MRNISEKIVVEKLTFSLSGTVLTLCLSTVETGLIIQFPAVAPA